jgi:hypothetical protein
LNIDETVSTSKCLLLFLDVRFSRVLFLLLKLINYLNIFINLIVVVVEAGDKWISVNTQDLRVFGQFIHGESRAEIG